MCLCIIEALYKCLPLENLLEISKWSRIKKLQLTATRSKMWNTFTQIQPSIMRMSPYHIHRYTV